MTDHSIAAQHRNTVERSHHIEDVLDMVVIGSGARRNNYPVRPELVEGHLGAARHLLRYRRFMVRQAHHERESSAKSGIDHIEDVLTMVAIGSGAQRNNYPVRPELVEGHLGAANHPLRCRKFMVRQAHHEREQSHHEREQSHHERE